MRSISVIVAMCSALSLAGVPAPPSPQWVEKPDPQAVDGGLPSRYFEKDGVPEVWFRVTQHPEIQENYDEALARKLPYRFKRATSEDDSKFKSSSPKLIPVELTVGVTFQFDRGDHLETIFYLPGTGGDFIVEAQTIKTRPIDLQVVLNTVAKSTGLRPVPLPVAKPAEPITPPPTTTNWPLIGAVIGIVVVLGVVGLRRVKKS